MDFSLPPDRPEPRRADALLALEADLERVTRELQLILARVSTTRRAWADPLVVTPPPPTAVAAPIAAPPPQPERPVPPPQPSRTPWWQRDGAIARVLSVVGAGVLLIGVALLLVLAIQNGYFGPVPRVVTTAAVSAVLLILGIVIHRRQPGNPGAVAMAACGVAGGYLDVVAATTIYGWLQVWTGLLAAGGVFAVGLLLSRRWGSQVLAVIVVLGVVGLAPVLVEDQPWVTSAFLVLVCGAALLIDRDRDWPVLQVARVVPAALVLIVDSLAGGGGDQPGPLWLDAGVCTAYAGLILVGQLVQLRRGRHAGLVALLMSISGLPALLAVPDGTAGHVTTVWLLALAAAWLGAAGWVRPDGPRAVLLSITALAVLVAFDLEGDLLVPALLVLAAGYLAAGLRQRVVGWVGVGVAGLGLALYLPILEPLVAGPTDGWFGWRDLLSSALVLTAAGLAHAFVRRAVAPRYRTGWLVGCWSVGLVAVTGLSVSAGVLLSAHLGTPAGGWIAGQAVATLVWMAAASWLLARGLRTSVHRPATVGVVLAGVAVAKLIVFDLATLDGVFRVLAFVVAGAALLSLGTVYARSRATTSPRVG